MSESFPQIFSGFIPSQNTRQSDTNVQQKLTLYHTTAHNPKKQHDTAQHIKARQREQDLTIHHSTNPQLSRTQNKAQNTTYLITPYHTMPYLITPHYIVPAPCHTTLHFPTLCYNSHICPTHYTTPHHIPFHTTGHHAMNGQTNLRHTNRTSSLTSHHTPPSYSTTSHTISLHTTPHHAPNYLIPHRKPHSTSHHPIERHTKLDSTSE